MDELQPAEGIQDKLEYDADTGFFYWKNPRSQKEGDDQQAGTITAKGYRRICWKGRFYFAHRLAWLYVYGAWPEQWIDHINGIRTDNRIVNLRDVSITFNNQNKHKPAVQNKLGILGVQKHRRKFRAMMQVNGRHVNLGLFHTAQEAHEAYVQGKIKYHEGFVP